MEALGSYIKETADFSYLIRFIRPLECSILAVVNYNIPLFSNILGES